MISPDVELHEEIVLFAGPGAAGSLARECPLSPQAAQPCLERRAERPSYMALGKLGGRVPGEPAVRIGDQPLRVPLACPHVVARDRMPDRGDVFRRPHASGLAAFVLRPGPRHGRVVPREIGPAVGLGAVACEDGGRVPEDVPALRVVEPVVQLGAGAGGRHCRAPEDVPALRVVEPVVEPASPAGERGGRKQEDFARRRAAWSASVVARGVGLRPVADHRIVRIVLAGWHGRSALVRIVYVHTKWRGRMPAVNVAGRKARRAVHEPGRRRRRVDPAMRLDGDGRGCMRGRIDRRLMATPSRYRAYNIARECANRQATG